MPKISQLTVAPSVSSDDLFVIVNDPSGSPSTRKVTAQGLLDFVDNGMGVVAVSKGGTGATTATDARTNLQVPYTFGTGGTSVVAWQSGDNLASGDWGVVGGGKGNTAEGLLSSVGGGKDNTASAIYSAVGGGQSNVASGNTHGYVGGGGANTADGPAACILGGLSNTCSSYTGTVGGGRANIIDMGASDASVLGGFHNTVSAYSEKSTIAGGYYNVVQSSGCFIGSGNQNTCSYGFASVVGGVSNVASGYRSLIGCGEGNKTEGENSFVGSGKNNTASGNYSFVAGGRNNVAANGNVFILGSDIVSDAPDTTYVENLNVKNNITLSSPLAVAYGGTGATNIGDIASGLGFGTLALQDMDNVTITGGTISIDGLFNVGLSLSSNSFSTAKVCARSPITDFRTVADTPIFTVPSGYMFLVDAMEVITTVISGAGTPPKVRFGTVGSEDVFYAASRTTSNSFGERHVIENPQNGVDAGSVVSFGIAEASTATLHRGAAVVTGYLLKKT